jgi:hypothetical protein
LAKEVSDDGDRGSRAANSGWGSTVWPLLVVVVIILLGGRWLKSHPPNAARELPGEAFDVLARKAIDSRTSVLLARCGSRLLLLSFSPHGLQTLTEITDPVEIDCLAGLCRTTQRDHGLAETFRSLLRKPVPAKPTASKQSPSPMPMPNSQSSLPNDSRWPDRMLSERGILPPSREERE